METEMQIYAGRESLLPTGTVSLIDVLKTSKEVTGNLFAGRVCEFTEKTDTTVIEGLVVTGENGVRLVAERLEKYPGGTKMINFGLDRLPAGVVENIQHTYAREAAIDDLKGLISQHP